VLIVQAFGEQWRHLPLGPAEATWRVGSRGRKRCPLEVNVEGEIEGTADRHRLTRPPGIGEGRVIEAMADPDQREIALEAFGGWQAGASPVPPGDRHRQQTGGIASPIEPSQDNRQRFYAADHPLGGIEFAPEVQRLQINGQGTGEIVLPGGDVAQRIVGLGDTRLVRGAAKRKVTSPTGQWRGVVG